MRLISPIQSTKASPPKMELKNSAGSVKPSEGFAESLPNLS
jgi:hypothetical protein